VFPQGFSIVLNKPVPQPCTHESKDWYHPTTVRAKAEELLRWIPRDGVKKDISCLDTLSSTYLNSLLGWPFIYSVFFQPGISCQTQRARVKHIFNFIQVKIVAVFISTIKSISNLRKSHMFSYRAEGKIKHCRIKQEGRLYIIGTAQFESLIDLVSYYEKNPLYRKVRLRYPVTEEIVRQRGVVSQLKICLSCISSNVYKCRPLIYSLRMLTRIVLYVNYRVS
jgi:hypothetical protein